MKLNLHNYNQRACLMRYALGLVVCLSMLAIFWLSFFHEGTSISKYAGKLYELEQVNEEQAVELTEYTLFDDPVSSEVSPELESTVTDSEERFEVVEQIRAVDRWLVVALTLLAVALVFVPNKGAKWGGALYLLIAGYMVLMAVTKGLNGGQKFSELAVLASALRWMPAVALGVLLVAKKKPEFAQKLVMWIMVIACSITFATHGVEAFLLNSPFYDLLYGMTGVVGLSFSESTCEILLRCIATMDIALAIFILFKRHAKVFYWMAAWGFLTALSRPISYGVEHWFETVLRSGNFLIPLTLGLLIAAPKIKNLKKYETKTT